MRGCFVICLSEVKRKISWEGEYRALMSLLNAWKYSWTSECLKPGSARARR